MASLRKLYAMGIQENNCSYTVVTNNTIKCNYCIRDNKIPFAIYYYGGGLGLLTNYSIDGKNDVKYNCSCSNGHLFIYCDS